MDVLYNVLYNVYMDVSGVFYTHIQHIICNISSLFILECNACDCMCNRREGNG